MKDEDAGSADASALTDFQLEVARVFFSLPAADHLLLAAGWWLVALRCLRST
jgi:hypothetical protein